MSPGLQRALGAVGAVAVSALVNVATGFFTGHQAVAWWASGIVMLVVGTLIQWWLPLTGSAVPDSRQAVTGNKVGGSVRQRMRGTGEQVAADNEITGDLTQAQDG